MLRSDEMRKGKMYGKERAVYLIAMIIAASLLYMPPLAIASVWEIVELAGDSNNDGTIDSVEYYTRDGHGNLTRKEFDNDNDGAIDSVEYYTRDGHGNLTRKEFDNDNDGAIDSVEYYTLDGNGNPTKIETDNDNDGAIDSVEYYTLDGNGNPTRKEFDNDNDGAIDQVAYYTWEYYTWGINEPYDAEAAGYSRSAYSGYDPGGCFISVIDGN
jgi:uncharacterized protein YjhX (UPF0386 family)